MIYVRIVCSVTLFFMKEGSKRACGSTGCDCDKPAPGLSANISRESSPVFFSSRGLLEKKSRLHVTEMMMKYFTITRKKLFFSRIDDEMLQNPAKTVQRMLEKLWT